MDPLVLVFLTSGLFLGWALGANDAANVFGTAVGTRMVSWKTAAIVCSIFVILGALISGAGASHTLGRLGAISALPGAFMTALSAAIAVYTMTKSGLPVSTSQAIVGAIIGWNLFSSNPTDAGTLTKILSTWIICPVLSGCIAVTLFKAFRALSKRAKVHMIAGDAYMRVALLLVGAFGAYSLGANNIANVVGVFIPAQPFPDIVMGTWRFSSTQQLFLLGGLAISLGVFTYSKGVMMTVGDNLGRLSPTAAFITVLSHSIVLFIFASRGLEAWLAGHGLPTIPLVPVSSSQAVVGAIVGISILQGTTGIQWSVLGKIVAGWIATPFAAGLVCFIGLFFLQNVFGLKVA
ncbi:MAG: inorganic phosphate transporter [Proteobacteria bacterium]|nr:inorganic phosphate transporter [Pseudomonadota bacterium]